MNPILALQATQHLRERIREHPARWGCLALLLVCGPFVVAMFLIVALVVVISGASGSASATPQHVAGIPDLMLSAYIRAAQRVTAVRPQCQGMRWSVLAGIAKMESNHAAGRAIAPNGDITPLIQGPLLDGSGVGGNHTPIRNPDGTFARAVGPFQFLTTTWASIAQDGNDDGQRNPHNAFDAALGAAVLLCGPGPRDLANEAQLRAAIFNYNHSQSYVDGVMVAIRGYDAVQLQPAAPADAAGAAKTVIDAAMAQHGVRYAWGGGTPAGPSKGGFDCSGLVLYAYAKVGISLPHSSKAQFNLGTRLPRELGLAALRPADLVFYSPGGIHHVGIYLGDGQMINAPDFGTVVRVDRVGVVDYAGGVRLLS